MSNFLKKHWQILLYVLIGVGLRFWNFTNSLYFIYDQGRDALVLQRLAHGSPVLVGPTTGLGGFFLGPLWYYLGVFGYWLGDGNPYVMCLWYMAIGCLALPLYWWLAHKLFKNKWLALLCAAILCVIPGSIHAAIFIWNPLLSVPLMLVAVYGCWRARRDRWGLLIGFGALALMLQSEFAYAVFFIVPMILAIPWLRRKFQIRDFVIVFAIFALSVVPQGLFELRHQGLMTKSLLASLADKSITVSWEQQLANRPTQLYVATIDSILEPGPVSPIFLWTAILLLILGLLSVFRWTFQKKKTIAAGDKLLWQLVALWAVLPYPFFLIWRGNRGYFFDYYITPHYIFLIPMIVLGLWQLWNWSKHWRPLFVLSALCTLILINGFATSSIRYLKDVVVYPDNQAGLAKMIGAVGRMYELIGEDPDKPAVVQTFTANVFTEQYDYLFNWYARAHHVQQPITVRNGSENRWYLLIESKEKSPRAYFLPWYKKATEGGKLIHEEQIGVLTLETWQKTP